jgi:S1-C subfamily serine protease
MPHIDFVHSISNNPQRCGSSSLKNGDDKGMVPKTDPEKLRVLARSAIDDLRGAPEDSAVEQAKALVRQLCEAREFELMGDLVEEVSRSDPNDPTNQRFYGQNLIERGMAIAAVALLADLRDRLPEEHPEHAEAVGLIGRAYKQIFIGADDKTKFEATNALEGAIRSYRSVYDRDETKTWHGINFVALMWRASKLGLPIAKDFELRPTAERLIQTLNAIPQNLRNEWHEPTVAEAHIALGDWDSVEAHARSFVGAGNSRAFQVGSFLRQLTQIWDVELIGDRGRDLVSVLRARLLELKGVAVELTPGELQQEREKQENAHQGDERALNRFEVVLGQSGANTYEWWKTGLSRARSVAAIRERGGSRFGTGFLVRAMDFGFEDEDDFLVLTNHHVINEHGSGRGVRPEDAEIIFEASDNSAPLSIDEIVWSSPSDQLDAALLRLEGPIVDIAPLELAASLPALGPEARVYIIGHPGGRELAFSFQDNDLLDHEGQPDGVEQIPGVARVHYRAPTEGGSSGSPVFNSRKWQVIALHHMGDRNAMPYLNGKVGTYGANEGISIFSIVSAARAAAGGEGR